MRKRRLRQHEIDELLARYLASGLNQKEFAVKEAVAVSSLQYWLRRAREGRSAPEAQPPVSKETTGRPARSSGSTGFIEVNLESRIGAATAPICYEIRYGDWSVTVPEGFSRESLAILLESIRDR